MPLLFGVGVFLLIAAGLFVPLEQWGAIRAQRLAPRAVVVCAGLLAIDTLGMAAIGVPLLKWVAAAPAGWSASRVLLVLVLADLCGYWLHRLMHRVPWLWRVHAVHHAPTELNWLEAWRQHPVDFVLHGLAVGLPGALLGVPLAELGGVVLLRKLFTSFLHANLRWRFGRVERWIATPAFHRTHHSAEPADHDSNFAGTFAWVDRLFGTYRHAARMPARLGLAEPRRS
ncbi:MAG: sterol desaturase family protein [Myxococcales bacterium]|nr:sterol desaturase family protein [Myxococcales bacterium]